MTSFSDRMLVMAFLENHTSVDWPISAMWSISNVPPLLLNVGGSAKLDTLVTIRQLQNRDIVDWLSRRITSRRLTLLSFPFDCLSATSACLSMGGTYWLSRQKCCINWKWDWSSSESEISSSASICAFSCVNCFLNFFSSWSTLSDLDEINESSKSVNFFFFGGHLDAGCPFLSQMKHCLSFQMSLSVLLLSSLLSSFFFSSAFFFHFCPFCVNAVPSLVAIIGGGLLSSYLLRSAIASLRVSGYSSLLAMNASNKMFLSDSCVDVLLLLTIRRYANNLSFDSLLITSSSSEANVSKSPHPFDSQQ